MASEPSNARLYNQKLLRRGFYIPKSGKFDGVTGVSTPFYSFLNFFKKINKMVRESEKSPATPVTAGGQL
jgi:hypothetical protein